jgi:hypothetical protein
MIEPVTVTSLLLGGYRLITSAERITFRVAGQREQRELVRTASRLPAGAEIGQMRPDGSYWWIRIPAGPDAPQKTR